MKKFNFYVARDGVQNCEECISNMLKSETCFENIHDYILGQKIGSRIGKLVLGKNQNDSAVPPAVRALKKFKAKKDKKIIAVNKEKVFGKSDFLCVLQDLCFLQEKQSQDVMKHDRQFLQMIHKTFSKEKSMYVKK